MSCDRWREWLSADLDDEARADEREALQQHLAACDGCRRAREAAHALRHGLAHAAAYRPGSQASDEQILQSLRRAGHCRGPIPVETSRSWCWALLTRRLSLPLLSVVSFGRFRGLPSTRPALAAMAVSFLLTWGSLRWAEMTPNGTSGFPSSSTAAVPARPGDPPSSVTDLEGEVLEQWLAESPSLGTLPRLQRQPAPAAHQPTPAMRGEVTVLRRRVG